MPSLCRSSPACLPSIRRQLWRHGAALGHRCVCWLCMPVTPYPSCSVGRRRVVMPRQAAPRAYPAATIIRHPWALTGAFALASRAGACVSCMTGCRPLGDAGHARGSPGACRASRLAVSRTSRLPGAAREHRPSSATYYRWYWAPHDMPQRLARFVVYVPVVLQQLEYYKCWPREKGAQGIPTAVHLHHLL